MEDVLDLYAEDPDPKRPVICFDESPMQLIGEARQPIPSTPDRPERYDDGYRRNGTAKLFLLVDAHRSLRKVKIIDRRTAVDFAHCMRDFVDVHWLNMVEIGVLGTQCIDRRIPGRGTLEREIDTGERQRNQSGVRIEWLFTTERARAKLARSYPRPAEES